MSWLDSGSRRVLRGGSWGDVSGFARVAYRYYFTPGNRYYGLGLRLMRRAR
jgi:formylglycine-generating enzyme required for sulfatase activity